MRPDLPWNVAGIPSEAREAARAAARREGLSTGEWLTRRILAGLSDMSEATGRSEWSSELDQSFRAAEPGYRPEPARRTEDRLAARRDSDEMLSHVSRSESATADIYRRIEEQLRGMARRLDASERSQSESNRVVSKAAVEMNIAAREQAQAFDQLGSHVAALADRLQQVERRDVNDSLREAVKALHQGLTRVADQITQTANQSASQISALAGNLENIAGRVGQVRQDAQETSHALEAAIATLDERVRTLEKAAQTSSGLLDRALEALDARQNAAKDATAATVAHLEDSIHRIENRGPDPSIEQRLSSIERTLATLAERLDDREGDTEARRKLDRLTQRLDALEAAQCDMQRAAEAQQAAKAAEAQQAAKVVEEIPPAADDAATFGPLPSFDAPPFPQVDTPLSAAPPPPFAASLSPFPGNSQTPAFAGGPQDFANQHFPEAAQPAFEVASEHDFGPQHKATAPSPTIDSYLSAARRSARAAAQAETEHATGFSGLRWPPRTETERPSRTRPLVLTLIVLVAIAIVATLAMSRREFPAPANPAVGALFEKAPVPVKKASTEAPPPAAMPAPVGSPVLPAQQAPAKPTPEAARPIQTTRPVPPAAVTPATAHTIPAAPALDRLTALANAGNAKAELIVGLKYLDGDGVPANEPEAAKWLDRAANAGEPVAEYRLGTLYERGRGVAADPAKADRWYLASANQGNRKAMHNLAVAYAEGSGVKKDFAEASRWFLKAANLGLSDSQFNLAVLYERGLGVPQNLIDAYKWYAIAASQGDIESKSRMTAIATQLSADDRSAAQHAADTFRPAPLDARANVAPTVAQLTR
ncbi:MAG: SEL1-like repeat protein [Alphaproteobacteria bacterium]|nr:SEL1-like repeat protein [Alphaproteobacteria bacterium]